MKNDSRLFTLPIIVGNIIFGYPPVLPPRVWVTLNKFIYGTSTKPWIGTKHYPRKGKNTIAFNRTGVRSSQKV